LSKPWKAGLLRISGSYQVRKWDEKTYDVFEDRTKATRATVKYAFSGDIEGVANVEYLMFYRSFDPKDPHKAEVQYVGMIKIAGKLRGRSGSFALTDNGKFEAGTASSNLSIIPGSGTGELSGISGSGSYTADRSGYAYEIDVTQ